MRVLKILVNLGFFIFILLPILVFALLPLHIIGEFKITGIKGAGLSKVLRGDEFWWE